MFAKGKASRLPFTPFVEIYDKVSGSWALNCTVPATDPDGDGKFLYITAPPCNLSGLPVPNYRVGAGDADTTTNYIFQYHDGTTGAYAFHNALDVLPFSFIAFILRSDHGTIEGTVTEQIGGGSPTPLSGVQVTPLRYNGSSYELVGPLSAPEDTLTDINGDYSLDLPPGDYIIRFYHPSYPQQYYDAKNFANADVVTVSSGQTTASIDAVFGRSSAPPVAETVHHPVPGRAGSTVTTDSTTGELDILVNVYSYNWAHAGDIDIRTDVICDDGLPPSNVRLWLDLLIPNLGNTDYKEMNENPAGSTVYEATIDNADIVNWGSQISENYIDMDIEVRWECSDGTTHQKPIGHLRLHDPSGFVTDADTGEPIPGATVTLYKVPGWRPRTSPSDTAPNTCESHNSKAATDPWSQPAPTDLGVVAIPGLGEISPAINPQQTDGVGHYGWDVARGCWYIIVQAERYETKVSPVVGVPPEVTDLNLELTPLPPVADFTVSAQSGPAPLSVVFTDISTGTVTAWLWDFGDGVTSDEQSPTHTYTETTVYSVSLTVSNSNGSDIITKTNFITVTSMPTPTISDVRITNVRDSSFSVSWLTDIESTGSIRYGTDPNNLNQSAEDVRGASTSDDTHYVLLDNLLPETTYYFLVVSGDTTDDNAGAHYNVTTGPTLGLPGSDTIYGSVFLTESIPAEGSIVYITLSDADAAGSSREAAPLSALVDHSGFWSINLGNARIADLSSYYSYSANGDTLFLEAQGAADGVGCEKIDTGVDSPARDIVLNVSSCTINKLINLQNGWNHISLPVEPTTMPLTAEEVCNDINAQGGNALEIDRWHASGWEGHICGLPFNNFELLLGSSYFIKSGSQSTWEIEGYQVTEPLSLTLHVGWTSIGIPHTDLYTADTLCDEIIAQGVTAVEIDRWHNGGWQGYICGLPFNHFQIERGVGYFIKSSSAGTVTPSAPQGKRTHLGMRIK